MLILEFTVVVLDCVLVQYIFASPVWTEVVEEMLVLEALLSSRLVAFRICYRQLLLCL